jgi:hypothetical protein
MGAYTEIVDFTFTANETSRTFSGLSITKDDFIKIVATITNGSSTETVIRLFPNTTVGVSGFDTNTNYHTQALLGNGTSVSASRSNINLLGFAVGSQTATFTSFAKLSENGKFNTFSLRNNQLTSSLLTSFDYCTSSNLTFNDTITSLTFTAGTTNGLGTGSRIQIYRLDAEKVADITTTANATQVDISSLSIGKDSEYLLVSDFDNNSTSSQDNFMTPNDLTTLSGYHYQRITGSGSTAAALRNNTPNVFNTTGSQKTLAYTHIKLSEIGAYTHQSYCIREQGTSTLSVENYFVSSTSEAIASITKLNIFATFTNGIKAGSRFMLYKLK